MKTKKLNGQILVIVLLMLSILSILVIAVVSTTTKDIQEQTQNKIYEQYNSINEQKLLQLQNTVSNLTITNTIAGLPCTFSISNPYTCTATNQVIDSTNGSTANITYEIKDSANITDYTLEKDKTLMLSLTGQVAPINFVVNPATATSWDFSVDYKVGASTYGTFKTVLTTSGVGYDAATRGPCFSSASTTNFGFAIPVAGSASTCTVPAGATLLYLRIRALSSVSVDITGLTANQFRTITTVTKAVAGTGPAASPTSILSVEYPLYGSPLDIMDYVLRSMDGNGIAK